MSNVYLCGPMSNIPYFNFPNFHNYAHQLRLQGHKVFNPAENDIAIFGTGIAQVPSGTVEEAETIVGRPVTYKECLSYDLQCILTWADAIALMPGWENSKGCTVEKALAECLKLEVINLD